MGKIIALWGCPGSGTSTTCVKLARAIYDRYAAKVLCLSLIHISRENRQIPTSQAPEVVLLPGLVPYVEKSRKAA